MEIKPIGDASELKPLIGKLSGQVADLEKKLKKRRYPGALPSTKPNRGAELALRKKLQSLIAQMKKETGRDILAAYQNKIADIAQDEAAGTMFIKHLAAQSERWQTLFDKAAQDVSQWFAESTERRSRADIQRKLKEAGFTVKLQMTPAIRAKVNAAAEEAAGLIKSVPKEYLRRVQRATMDSFQAGRDLAALKKDILAIGYSTDNRAALIARDQMDKATQAFAIAEAQSVGATKGRWLHVPGVKSSRRTHVAFDGQEFNLDRGLYDDDAGKEVLPGDLPYCSCQFQVILPGFQ
jgi:uncharacterized protein with gpF-like domain